jgi:hypothetical protein
MIRGVIAQRNLTGLANDTKWDEFINAIREWKSWKPGFRWKCVDGPISPWDYGWYYHLPFPLISAEWLDLRFLESTTNNRLPAQTTVTDHSAELIELLDRIGLDYKKGNETIRIFGYAPRCMDRFDQL